MVGQNSPWNATCYSVLLWGKSGSLGGRFAAHSEPSMSHVHLQPRDFMVCDDVFLVHKRKAVFPQALRQTSSDLLSLEWSW